MKAWMVIAIVSWLTADCLAQKEYNHSVKVSNDTERVPVVRASLALSDAHEQSFWEIYEQYEQKRKDTFAGTTAVLNGLAKAGESAALALNDNEYIHKLFQCRNNDLAVRKEYFNMLCSRTNSAIGLQFLQTEELLDLIGRSKLYEESVAHKPQVDLYTFEVENYAEAKRRVIASTLDLPEESGERFWQLYDAYEYEYDTLFGGELNVFEQYVKGAPEEVTPAQARALGHEFLAIQHTEVQLKEKYFLKLNDILGASLAARFIALEDYFSSMAKIKTWVDASFANADY